ncbi:DUF924-domain-containing protein [Bimuria novae-zelandiae CBS 107.79]|uniref:DUF924-domain-containing protein n=1 Tax=Bimuria novae-zelandiae CBS 107.79 TaxID=1447943 RepID=A0A6A5VM69_9PLEO|nr:DUF924-domain-containing protein [Bimuria novae-zelandiae CBS 107.79]
MDPEAMHVVAFWFNRPPIEWNIASDGLDDQMKSEFGSLVQRARRSELDSWITHPESSVALVALLDQFSRNIFRGTLEAFNKQVSVIKASALYMPLMQDESLISLIATRCLFEALKTRCTNKEEHKHILQLETFGRYPTRNAILGRKSTGVEEEYLRDRVTSL